MGGSSSLMKFLLLVQRSSLLPFKMLLIPRALPRQIFSRCSCAFQVFSFPLASRISPLLQGVPSPAPFPAFDSYFSRFLLCGLAELWLFLRMSLKHLFGKSWRFIAVSSAFVVLPGLHLKLKRRQLNTT